MPTQRPFFSNFFSAFRARSTPGPFQAKSSTTTGAISTSTALSTQQAHTHTHSHTHTPAASAPRNIAKPEKSTSPGPTFAALSSSPGATFYRRPPSPSPIQQTPRGRQRRDSGSSHTSGFVDAVGSEKWYVGGRTATGEERFYQLGLVTNGTGQRMRSLDRLSL